MFPFLARKNSVSFSVWSVVIKVFRFTYNDGIIIHGLLVPTLIDGIYTITTAVLEHWEKLTWEWLEGKKVKLWIVSFQRVYHDWRCSKNYALKYKRSSVITTVAPTCSLLNNYSSSQNGDFLDAVTPSKLFPGYEGDDELSQWVNMHYLGGGEGEGRGGS